MREVFQQYMKDWQHYSFAGRNAIVTARSNRNRVYLYETHKLNFGLMIGEGIIFNEIDFPPGSAEANVLEDHEIISMCLSLGVAMKLLDVSCGCDFVLRRLLWCGDYWCVDVRGNSLRSFFYEKVRHCGTCGEKLPVITGNDIYVNRFERICQTD